jgi:hypothetical protein
MASQVAIDKNGGRITTSVRLLRQHIGNTAIDLWLDTDHNGAPDKFVERIKQPTDAVETVEVGKPQDVRDKVIQWIWQPSQPSNSDEGWLVRIDVQQEGQSLPGFPRDLHGEYPPEKWGLFQTWVKLV